METYMLTVILCSLITPLTAQVDGGWSDWSAWLGASCCDGSVVSAAFRIRHCANPPAQNGGACPGSNNEVTEVNCSRSDVPGDPINGCWSSWGGWLYSECSATCGPNAVRQGNRTRTCTEPPPANSGMTCSGNATDTTVVSCGPDNCQRTWTQWSEWTVSCDVTCGSSASGVGMRTRFCTGGTLCPGVNSETRVQPCGLNDCPDDESGQGESGGIYMAVGVVVGVAVLVVVSAVIVCWMKRTGRLQCGGRSNNKSSRQDHIYESTRPGSDDQNTYDSIDPQQSVNNTGTCDNPNPYENRNSYVNIISYDNDTRVDFVNPYSECD